SDYAEFLKTCDPNEEDTGSEKEVTQKLPTKEDSKLPESDQVSK
ncbi:hypothetical protein A2U01_0061415, partial [Trifolium medium]|nr:hypothetical protein [Trifolium medium]